MPALGLPPAALRPGLTLFGRWAFSPRASWPTVRKRLEAGVKLPPPPRGTEVRAVSLRGVPGEELRPPGGDPARVLLFFHGGAYTAGSLNTHRSMAARLAAGAGTRAVVVDYRLAPEHPYPAAVQDAQAAWGALVEDEGVPADRIVVAGDSAGGGLAAALGLALRDAGGPLPAALGLICPWLDLTAPPRHPSPREALLSDGVLRRAAQAYLSGGADAADPLVSPLKGDLAGLPPLVIHTCADDPLASDGRAMAQRARDAGVAVAYEEVAGVWHDVHLSAPLLREPAGGAPGRLAAGLRAHLAG